MKNKNKLLFIILFFLILVIFVFNNAVLGAESITYTITGYNGEQYTFPEFIGNNIQNGFFIQCWNGTYYLGVFNSDNVHLWKNGYRIASNVSYKEYLLNENTNTWDFYRDMSANGEITGESLLFYTSYDIYTTSSSNDVAISKTGTNFFLPEPEVTLAGILAENSPVQMFQTLMKKLVVSLLVFLIGLIGLRKGWTFLKTALHKA